MSYLHKPAWPEEAEAPAAGAVLLADWGAEQPVEEIVVHCPTCC